jgi:Domain of unknown function (DUF4279)
MRSDLRPRTYATLSIAGDHLDPKDVAEILPAPAKRAHRKGEKFYAGQRAGTLTGRTGIWYFDTRDVASDDLTVHLHHIVKLLYPEPGNTDRVSRLRKIMGREHAHARVSCFWYGKPGMEAPSIPPDILEALKGVPVEFERDFYRG